MKLSYGRMSDILKTFISTNHVLDPDCRCSIFGCLNIIRSEERNSIIEDLIC